MHRGETVGTENGAQTNDVDHGLMVDDPMYLGWVAAALGLEPDHADVRWAAYAGTYASSEMWENLSEDDKKEIGRVQKDYELP